MTVERTLAPLLNVLLIDDYADARQMYAECLRAAEFRPIELDDTAGALAAAERADAIVTGIRVPGPVDGIELVRRLRAEPRTRHKPVIVLTACVVECQETRARDAGCDAFLTKPCAPDVLLDVLRALLDAPRRSAVRPPFRGDAFPSSTQNS